VSAGTFQSDLNCVKIGPKQCPTREFFDEDSGVPVVAAPE